MTAKRKFNFPMSTLLYEANLILSQAEKQTAFASKRLRADLLTESRTTLQGLGGKGADAGAATSATGELTQQQDDAIVQMLDLFGQAKESARRAFPGNETKLRGEFKVGENTPRDLASVLKRAEAVRDACKEVENVGPLKDKGGWIADDTAALAAAIGTVDAIDKQQLQSMSLGLAGTDERNTAANKLFDNLLTIQNAAGIEWPERKAENRAMRTDFRMEDFPPAQKAKASAKTESSKPADVPGTK